MSDYQEFKNLYKRIKDHPLWIITYKSTGRVIGFQSMPNTLLGKCPVYERKYEVEKLSLKNKDDIFSALIRDNYVFETKEEAEALAEELNEKEKGVSRHSLKGSEELQEFSFDSER